MGSLFAAPITCLIRQNNMHLVRGNCLPIAQLCTSHRLEAPHIIGGGGSRENAGSARNNSKVATDGPSPNVSELGCTTLRIPETLATVHCPGSSDSGTNRKHDVLALAIQTELFLDDWP